MDDASFRPGRGVRRRSPAPVASGRLHSSRTGVVEPDADASYVAKAMAGTLTAVGTNAIVRVLWPATYALWANPQARWGGASQIPKIPLSPNRS